MGSLSRLIEFIGGPRNTIYNTFRIDLPEDISKSMFFASAQSLDRMAEVSSKGFKNSPIVMGELTKFLALDSNYELVGKLHSKIGSIQTSQDSLEKEVAASVKSSSTFPFFKRRKDGQSTIQIEVTQGSGCY